MALLALAALPGAPLHAEVYYFAGSNTGDIPDNDPAGRIVAFNVAGLDGPITGVALDTSLDHSWSGDVIATLQAPGNQARLLVVGRMNALSSGAFGASSDLSGDYRFSDDADGDLWAAASTTPIPVGAYRSSTLGGSANGGCPTSLNTAFGGLSAATAAGSWELKVVDRFAGDTGSINSATLIITTNGDTPGLFASGFESPPAARPAKRGTGIAPSRCINKVRYDFTGNGLSDFAYIEYDGGTIRWHIHENLGGGNAAPTERSFLLGDPASDFVDAIDIDGDRIADPTTWTQGVPAVFRVLRSTRPGSAPLEIEFGQNGDDPIQSGDYDGDGLDDLALVRAPNPAGPIMVRVRQSSDPSTLVFPIGTGTAFTAFAIGGFDYDGNGLADIAVQTTNPDMAGGGLLTVYDGQGLGEISSYAFGNNTDLLIPGNFVGDAVNDVTVGRNVGGERHRFSRDSSTGVEAAMVNFGLGTDSIITGDYDGDGYTDHAYWRPSTTPGESAFSIRPSSNTGTTWTVPMGESGNYPLGNARVK